MIDYHIHSEHSGDAEGPVFAACEHAIKVGLTEIGFTDHLDFDPTDSCYQKFFYDIYKSQIEAARETYDGKLLIRCGIEVDFQEKYRSMIEDYLDGKEFDYIIGSAHYVDGILLENHHLYFPGRDRDEAYRTYFDVMQAAVNTGFFDIVPHLDLCKRYGVRYYGDFDPLPYWDQITGILQTAIERGMSLEINTSGLRQSPEDTYPTRKILEYYYSLGGRNITVGSDAHTTRDVGSGIAKALELAGSIGFSSVGTYNKRKRCEKVI